MNFNEYQLLANRTKGKFDRGIDNIACYSMGIAGESGELVDYLKKVLYHGKQIDLNHVEKEIGDVLWYLAELSSTLHLDLDTIAFKNIEKLKLRYPDGFSYQASNNRREDSVESSKNGRNVNDVPEL